MSFAATTNPILSPLAGSRDTQLGDQGQFFVGLNPTPGTGIASNATVTAFTETTPILVLFNASNTVSIYPMFLRGHITAAGTGVSTAVNWTFTLDTGNRFTSGGTPLLVNNINQNSTNLTSAIANYGAVLATAATGARRIVAHTQVKHTVIEVIHDTYAFNFGGGYQSSTFPIAANSTTPTYANYSLAPIVIGPLQSLVVVRWGAAQANANSAEVEMGWVEK